jgi:hypothetical protein
MQLGDIGGMRVIAEEAELRKSPTSSSKTANHPRNVPVVRLREHCTFCHMK